MLLGLDEFQMPAAIGGRGDRLILNQLRLVVHTVNYLMCFLEVRVGARSQEDRILPSTSKILCLCGPNPPSFLCTLIFLAETKIVIQENPGQIKGPGTESVCPALNHPQQSPIRMRLLPAGLSSPVSRHTADRLGGAGSSPQNNIL